MAGKQCQPIYKIPLIAGKFIASDIQRILVNETLVKNLGIKNPEDALNKNISLWNGFLKRSDCRCDEKFQCPLLSS
jgi:hypothetical protein